MRLLYAKCSEISEPRYMSLESSDWSQTWQASGQQLCRGPHQNCITLQWRHSERDFVSIHQPHDYLLSRVFRRWSKKPLSSASLPFVRGIPWWPVNSSHKGPVTRNMFPFDDVIMNDTILLTQYLSVSKLRLILHKDHAYMEWQQLEMIWKMICKI